ncbi:MAG: hypothetical protein HY080_14870 [Gammaproteobacteria bacterium]|nr:hypothetical protein [Gammaproteobacteria bacterium]
MNTQTVLVRTAKGKAALETKQSALDQRQRFVLVMVDGHNNLTQISNKGLPLPDLMREVNGLMRDGYIKTLSHFNPSPPPSTPHKTASMPKIQTPALIRQELIRTLRLMLDDDSDAFIDKIENTPANTTALTNVANTCVKLVRLTLDETKADKLQGQFKIILSKLR